MIGAGAVVPWVRERPSQQRNARRAHISAVVRLVREQALPVQESALWVAVLEQAIDDATDWFPKCSAAETERAKQDRADARLYLQLKPIPACEIIGIDSDWLRGLLRVSGLLLIPYRTPSAKQEGDAT